METKKIQTPQLEIIDRKGSYSIKVDAIADYYGREDLIPLWVADMDFKSPACIREALQGIVDQGCYGYNHIPRDYFPTIKEWLFRQQDWKVETEWLAFIPGIVKGIGYAVNYFTRKGDGIVIQPPVYPPFTNVPKGNGRKLLFNPLIRVEGDRCPFYRMDFENLEEICRKESPKLLILCNPHNPGGIAWDADTLRTLASICARYGVLVVSDEIHADMPLFGHRHIPFASVSGEAARISITFGAPSKTFNMAGIVSSYAVVSNPELREGFYHWMQVNELEHPTLFATLATIAAYTQGDPWRKVALKYIEENILFIEEYCRTHFQGLVQPLRPCASFLIWLDCRELAKAKFGSVDQPRLVDLFVDKAHLALNDGAAFGIGGEGYMRLNVGCGRETLQKAMDQLYEAVRG